WRTHDDAVKVVRETLRGDEALAAARRAAVEIGPGGWPVVVRLDDGFGGDGGHVHGAIGEVDELLRVDGEARVRLAGVVVSGVGRRHREATCEGVVTPLEPHGHSKRLTREPTVAKHVEPSVPRMREADLKPHFREHLPL